MPIWAEVLVDELTSEQLKRIMPRVPTRPSA